MALVAAKCTECGASIEVDDNKEAGICRHCGTAFITQKAITSYNTYVTNNIVIDAETKEELLKNVSSLQTARKQCERLIEIGEFRQSFTIANEIIEKWVESPIGYLLAIRSMEEYRAYNTPQYESVLKRSTSEYIFGIQCSQNGVTHTIETLYKKLIKRLTKQEIDEYKDILSIVKTIILDFRKSMKLELPQKQKRMLVTFGVSFSVLIAFTALFIVSIVNDIVGLFVASFIIIFFAFFVSLYFLIVALVFRSANKTATNLNDDL